MFLRQWRLFFCIPDECCKTNKYKRISEQVGICNHRYHLHHINSSIRFLCKQRALHLPLIRGQPPTRISSTNKSITWIFDDITYNRSSNFDTKKGLAPDYGGSP